MDIHPQNKYEIILFHKTKDIENAIKWLYM